MVSAARLHLYVDYVLATITAQRSVDGVARISCPLLPCAFSPSSPCLQHLSPRQKSNSRNMTTRGLPTLVLGHTGIQFSGHFMTKKEQTRHDCSVSLAPKVSGALLELEEPCKPRPLVQKEQARSNARGFSAISNGCKNLFHLVFVSSCLPSDNVQHHLFGRSLIDSYRKENIKPRETSQGRVLKSSSVPHHL